LYRKIAKVAKVELRTLFLGALGVLAVKYEKTKIAAKL
jgi:hypothetical protein